MADKKLKKRSEIATLDKWNIEKMYPDESKWEEDIDWCVKESESLKSLSGMFLNSSNSLLDALKRRDALFLKLEHAIVYSHMKKDEDNKVSKYIAMEDKAGTACALISANLSFFTPELLSKDENTILGYIKENPALKTYEFYIKDALREKSHILSKEEENLIAQMSEVTDTAHDVFTMLNNAEMSFGEILDEDGDKITVTHGNYIELMHSHDREVRKHAYTHMYEAYKGLINTISTCYSSNVKTTYIYSRIRKYESSRAHALSSSNIPEEVYDNLIDVVNEYLPVMHKYTELRKRILGVDELKMYDVYVPLVKLPKREYTFKEAISLAKEGLALMGDEYLNQFSKGIQDRWIDIYENEGKTSGAYSFGAFDSDPYVLLNFSSSLNDVFTIVHEMGHSMHSYYTRKTQPFIYGDHSIFTAEVASTVNESLLIKHLLEVEKDPEMRKYLINYYIEEFRTTLFRQTMFAEFERLTHKAVENGEALTSDFLCNEYEKLNKKYFGPALSCDEYIKYEWARIPHFYRDFYVYQYATGYSAATAISKKIIEEGPKARDKYIEFLKSGSSNYPVELLKIAGVDMSKPEPIRLAMETVKSLVEELEKLL